jgi:conjugative coupling factor TraD (TOL family)
MNRNPLESRLRPAYEGYSATVFFLAAIGVLCAPETFLLRPPESFLFSITLGLFAFWRLRQGLKILHYRLRLRVERSFMMPSNAIPPSAQWLFLGCGFRWEKRHSQRLMEVREAEREYLLQRIGPPALNWLLSHCGWGFKPFVPSLAGGEAALHGVETEEAPVWMRCAERVGHTLVLGSTRVGKTRLAEILITQDIHRGDVVIVFDPKGDVALLERLYAEAQRAGRASEFFLFHLGHPEYSARYNPVGDFSRITEVATRVSGQLPAEGQSAAFRQFVWRFVNVVARALVALGRKPDYEQINRYASNIESLLVDYYEFWFDHEPSAVGWRTVVEALVIDRKLLDRALQARGVRALRLIEFARQKNLYEPIAHGLASTFNYEKSYFDKLVASLLPLMEKLTSGSIAALLSPEPNAVSDWRPLLDWASVIQLRGIVYVGLDSLSDFEVAAVVGNAMFADLTSVAGRLYKYGAGQGIPGADPKARICLHADEFNELIGEEFIPLLNKSGGAGFAVTAYTQTWSDVEARIGSKAKAGQIAGNFNTLIMLRVKELATAKLLTDQLPEVHVTLKVASSSVSDPATLTEETDFSTKNEDRLQHTSAPLIQPTDLMQLPKGEAFALLHGGHLYKLRFPLPPLPPMVASPQRMGGVEGIGRHMRERARPSVPPVLPTALPASH